MKMKYGFLGAVVAFCVVIGSGCATNQSAMVRITPSRDWDPRTADELYRDLNRVAPVPIPAGDFVVNKGMTGPSCWVGLGDPQHTRTLLRALKNHPDWVVSSVGQMPPSARPLFGLAAEPGSPVPGASRAGYTPTVLASR